MSKRPPRDLLSISEGHDPLDASVSGIGFITHRQRPSGWTIRAVANPRHHILALALDGKAHYECEGRSFEATRGTVLYFPPGVEHSARSDAAAPWSFYSVGFTLQTDRKAAEGFFLQLPRFQRLSNFTQFRVYFDQLERAWRGREIGYSMVCRATIMLILQHYGSASVRGEIQSPHASRIETIIQTMHQNVGRVDPIWLLAEQADLSESRFRFLFREMTGHSVTRYQNRLRILAAKDLLSSGLYAVGEVADELGFRDVYYFSRLFKRFTGLPPSAFRTRTR